MRLKPNQHGLHEAVARLCAERDPVDRHETADRGRHGRQEHRRVEVFAVADQLPPEWRGTIACAARVSRLSWCKDTRTGLWRPRREVAYYVSQVRLDAEDFGRAVRAHWGIENRDHHVRDRILREDDSRPGPMPGRLLAGINLLDTATHTWDLAVATGQPPELPEPVAVAALEASEEIVTAELRQGRFGPARAVPDGASPTDRLTAYLGRTPA